MASTADSRQSESKETLSSCVVAVSALEALQKSISGDGVTSVVPGAKKEKHTLTRVLFVRRECSRYGRVVEQESKADLSVDVSTVEQVMSVLANERARVAADAGADTDPPSVAEKYYDDYHKNKLFVCFHYTETTRVFSSMYGYEGPLRDPLVTKLKETGWSKNT